VRPGLAASPYERSELAFSAPHHETPQKITKERCGPRGYVRTHNKSGACWRSRVDKGRAAKGQRFQSPRRYQPESYSKDETASRPKWSFVSVLRPCENLRSSIPRAMGARRNSLGLRLMASERSRSGRPMARRRVPGLSRIASDAAAACWSTAYGLPVHKRGGARAGIYALVCQDGQTPPLNGRIQNSLPTAPANRIR
jgi:hypothetical protein